MKPDEPTPILCGTDFSENAAQATAVAAVLAERVMGSVALGVLQHCRRPVLVVWPPVA